MRECVPGARPAGGEALDRLDRRVRRRAVCVRSPRPHVATQCNAFDQSASRCSSTTPRSAGRYIGKLGVRPILPLLHEIDAIAELRRLNVRVLVQRHAPKDGLRALTRLSLTCKHARVCVRVCVRACVCARSGQTELLRPIAIRDGGGDAVWQFDWYADADDIQPTNNALFLMQALSLPSALIAHAGVHDAM